MSVFCEYLCYALKFALLSESFCCSLNICVAILSSVKSLCYFKKGLLCLAYVSIDVRSRQRWMLYYRKFWNLWLKSSVPVLELV